LKILTYDEVINAGRQAKASGNYSSVVAKPDDVYMFSYTSGTTGDPKGVKVTHKMIIQCATAIRRRFN
jgi:long-subunit acyl-CoA synthetase (AMP-forming)